MKTLKLAFLSLTALASLSALYSCSSDRNPFDTIIPTEKNTAVISLKFDVASTRADDDINDILSTDAEKKFSKVCVYVFDESDKLEMPEIELSVTSGVIDSLEVKPGKKTIYAISAKSADFPQVADGSSLTSFEETLFSSKISDLKSSKEFMMVGKSDTQMVMRSASALAMPPSNVFNIRLIRLVAKTQVKFGNVNVSSLGFSMGSPTFRVSQTCDKMRLKPNGVNVYESFTGSSNGTFAGYTVVPDINYINVVSGDFSADNCHYLSENIVDNPVAGNTTFVTLIVPFTPEFYYTYGYDGKLSKSSPGISGQSFCAVGIVDETNGFEDFAIDPETKHVITFSTQDEAKRYVEALNGGTASAMTVSEHDASMKVVAPKHVGTRSPQFQSVLFSSGLAYYRINIGDSDGNLKVERNKYYKITVNSIKNLGFHAESLLRPLNPESSPENSTSAWIEAVFSVAPWDKVDQGVDL